MRVVLGNRTATADSEAPAASDSRRQAGPSDDLGDSLFSASLPTIEGVIRELCRRNRLRSDEADEFGAYVRFALIERNCDVLRRYNRTGSLRSYLTVVVSRLFYDFRCQRWGRWRPSAEAQRHGPLAILLERLIVREGWSFDQAEAILRTHHDVTDTREQLRAIYQRLPPASPKIRLVAVDAAENVASRDLAADVRIVQRRIASALHRARETLTAEDRVILRLRFDEGFPVSQIAVALDINQKRMYRRLENILKRLRERLVREGIALDDVNELFRRSRPEFW
jgi:RNA polymerase sigma factor (sigma-70 family)